MSLVGHHHVVDQGVSEAVGGRQELDGDAGVHFRVMGHSATGPQFVLGHVSGSEYGGEVLAVDDVLPQGAHDLSHHLPHTSCC